MFSFEAGTLEENMANFCIYCGRPIEDLKKKETE